MRNRAEQRKMIAENEWAWEKTLLMREKEKERDSEALKRYSQRLLEQEQKREHDNQVRIDRVQARMDMMQEIHHDHELKDRQEADWVVKDTLKKERADEMWEKTQYM